jgi:2-polyprenyl-3-methyl-5-hydroxy-6-metoxy-1,4-benzoquinol methylase
MRDLDFQSGSFDRIIALSILEHIDDPVAELTRFRAWLGPAGVIHIPVNLAGSLHRHLGWRWG